ncbi:MAG: BolA family transcriptional regulator [Sideroxydans sp.]|nr:BolA family transcriptional regulator [Sideroxydans sp.]
MSKRIEQMSACLQVFRPVSLEIIDESYQHVGHAGARSGGGHYVVKICSAEFAGKNTMVRHRMIYSVLAEMMKADIHALTIQATSPEKL